MNLPRTRLIYPLVQIKSKKKYVLCLFASGISAEKTFLKCWKPVEDRSACFRLNKKIVAYEQ